VADPGDLLRPSADGTLRVWPVSRAANSPQTSRNSGAVVARAGEAGGGGVSGVAFAETPSIGENFAVIAAAPANVPIRWCHGRGQHCREETTNSSAQENAYLPDDASRIRANERPPFLARARAFALRMRCKSCSISFSLLLVVTDASFES
jgi:hypothetical protein